MTTPKRGKKVEQPPVPLSQYHPPTRMFGACGACARLCLCPEAPGLPLRTPLLGFAHACEEEKRDVDTGDTL